MKKRLLLIGSLMAAGSFLCTQAMAETVSLTKDIQGFSKISLNSAGEVILKQGDKDSVRVEIDNTLLPELEVSKSWNTLNLGLKHSDDYRQGSVKFYVTMKDISEISSRNSGTIDVVTDINTKDLELSLKNSGSIHSKDINAKGETEIELVNSGDISLGQLKTNQLELELANSGSIDIDKLVADSLKSSLENSGSISISGGSVNHQEISLRNSGSYKAKDLESNTAKVDLSGSGSIYANVKNEISVDISGSGDLYLSGKPSFKSISTSGSGSIHSM
ncbi:head GIN domain-containing protein [Dongshaea marina]|uniref:head GIN domain-containing protein n=1 Tax=Dongshaea marina TaxID=2047966 RepID=UPI000D3E3713|nr:head GIN domain-containing protein [Dongshaea marina]